ncbi:Protein kinase superfamily protein [Rhynchospora pubera]|uniref:non-specific serine/threonine protein kinase n=1 Tax=Rhynchospora pubera TaxID=906938 RepID=A0AAV8DGW6_9POAL|nr:Protein kinase superfamily protein [Rhynchospora pubera]
MATSRDDSDYDSSSSSFTAIGSRRSWLSEASLASSSSISVRSCYTEPTSVHRLAQKPHKSTQAEWEAIKLIRSVNPTGRVGLEHFMLVRRLGSGDLGNVYLCRLRDPRWTGCLFAMKVVDREALTFRNKLQRAETEREILRSLDHPFLPTLYADFEAAHYSCLVMEFCTGGDLHVARQRQPGRRFGVSSARFYAAETLLALEYLHMMGVVYRDLKPENILVRDDGHIMLSDFDLSLRCDVVPKLFHQKKLTNAISDNKNHKNSISALSSGSISSCVAPIQPVLSCFYSGVNKCNKEVAREEATQEATGGDELVKETELKPELVAEPVSARSKSFVGTHEYLAPEVISGAGHGSAVDWWTLGVFLYEMLYGRTLFKGEDNEKTLINIIKQPLSFPKLCAGSTKEMEDIFHAQDLISKLLVKNPKKRIGCIKGSVEIKRHEFFKGVNWALIRSVRPPEVPREMRKTRSSNVSGGNYRILRKERERETPAFDSIPPYFEYF